MARASSMRRRSTRRTSWHHRSPSWLTTLAPVATVGVSTPPATPTATTVLTSRPASVDRDSDRGRTILIAMGALVAAAIAGIATEARRSRRRTIAAGAAGPDVPADSTGPIGPGDIGDTAVGSRP